MKKLWLVSVVIMLLFLGVALPKEEATNTKVNEYEMVMEEEGYIDDIPFNTEEVVKQIKEDEKN